jgi:hypothetical protein
MSVTIAPRDPPVLIVYDQFGPLILADFPAAVDCVLLAVAMFGGTFRSTSSDIPTTSLRVWNNVM